MPFCPPAKRPAFSLIWEFDGVCSLPAGVCFGEVQNLIVFGSSLLDHCEKETDLDSGL